MDNLYIQIEKNKIEFCINKNKNLNLIYDNFFWCNKGNHKFYCWTCFSYEKKYNIGIIFKNDFYFMKKDFQHYEKCIEGINKIKRIKKFIHKFNKDDSDYRKIIDYFKTKIKEAKISKDKLELAEDAKKMLDNNKEIILNKKKGNLMNHYEIMSNILNELNKIDD